MAKFIPNVDRLTLEEQLKVLGDDELLDFWEEAQFLSKVLEDDIPPSIEATMEYEQLILKELQLRSCRRTIG